MSAVPMHGEAAGATQPHCWYCGEPFTPRKRWQAFCGPQHRNAFHAAEAHQEKIRAAAQDMYDALLHIVAGNWGEHESCASIARAALAKAGYREPKAP